MELVQESNSFGGFQKVFAHSSAETKTKMRFAVYVPPGEGPFPALLWLSGLTCTEENFIVKSGAQRIAAELGLVLISPDTSPRGPDLEGNPVPGDPENAYDFGLGAGYYVDATEAPWATHYRMRSYVEKELLPAVAEAAPEADLKSLSISGHSMGGHGALTVALRNPGRFKSVSAFAPICSPMNSPWGEKAFSRFLGADRARWRQYDSCALIDEGARLPEILVDQGTVDPYLETQLKPDLLVKACAAAGQKLVLRRQSGYDHSYYFISTFLEDHFRWHRERLG